MIAMTYLVSRCWVYWSGSSELVLGSILSYPGRYVLSHDTRHAKHQILNDYKCADYNQYRLTYTLNPRYNDSICCQRRCH